MISTSMANEAENNGTGVFFDLFQSVGNMGQGAIDIAGDAVNNGMEIASSALKASGDIATGVVNAYIGVIDSVSAAIRPKK
uniref:Chlorosome envelope protein B n=1 Tax=Chlorobium phaeovibrioides (strain DSM 265 / 1930) TaxID=290318 RepID=A4SED4_CHLPM